MVAGDLGLQRCPWEARGNPEQNGQGRREGWATYGAGLFQTHGRHDLLSASQQHCEEIGESPPLHWGDRALGGYIFGPKSGC